MIHEVKETIDATVGIDMEKAAKAEARAAKKLEQQNSIAAKIAEALAAKNTKIEVKAALIQNGQKRPKEGTISNRVWEIADKQSAELGVPAIRKNVIAAAVADDISYGTAKSHYAKWRAFHGLTRVVIAEIRKAALKEGV